MTIQPEFATVQTNGIRLRVALAGKGPLVVLVHGWPESWYSWRHQIPALAEAGYRVAAPDVRGYGGSDKPAAIEAYAIKEMCADIAGLVEGLGERQAILVGHDWGAPIVWNTSLFFPQRVRAVAGLSVPHAGRGPAPRIELFRNIYKDRFFYQLYFQQPGVAEAEFETDVRASLRKIYYSDSGEGRKAAPRPAKPADAKYLDGRPESAAGLAHARRPRLLRRGIRKEWLSRTAQPLPHVRARLRPAGGDRGPPDRATGFLYRRQP